jgi:hypothetical protein
MPSTDAPRSSPTTRKKNTRRHAWMPHASAQSLAAASLDKQRRYLTIWPHITSVRRQASQILTTRRLSDYNRAWIFCDAPRPATFSCLACHPTIRGFWACHLICLRPTKHYRTQVLMSDELWLDTTQGKDFRWSARYHAHSQHSSTFKSQQILSSRKGPDSSYSAWFLFGYRRRWRFCEKDDDDWFPILEVYIFRFYICIDL